MKTLLLIITVFFILTPGETRASDEITLIFTNDIHGKIISQDAFWLDSDTEVRVGGFPKFATYMEQQRQQAREEERPLLYLDGGDFLSGTPESDLLNGRPLISGLNLTGLDYAVFGNHEIDLGTENLKKRLDELDAEVLATNLRYGEEERTFPHTIKYAVEKLDEVEIGLFGLVHKNTPEMALPALVEDLTFLPELETAETAVEKLTAEDVDIIVAVTHLGLERDRRLATEVDGIDVIIGGHSHDLLWQPEEVNQTLITQAGGRLRNAGRLDLRIDNGEIIEHEHDLTTLYGHSYPPDTGMQKVMDEYLQIAEDFLNEKVGRTTDAVVKDSSRDGPLGNLVTDVMRAAVGADLALINPLGVLDELPAGEVTRRDLIRVVRFGNHLVELEFTGKQIKEIFEDSFRFHDRLYQFSGGRVAADTSADRGERVMSIKIGGQDFEPGDTYSVAATDFVAGQEQFAHYRERTDYSEQRLWQLLEIYFQTVEKVEPRGGYRYQFQ